jgi:hypothetical protein
MLKQSKPCYLALLGFLVLLTGFHVIRAPRSRPMAGIRKSLGRVRGYMDQPHAGRAKTCCKAWNESTVLSWTWEPSKRQLVEALARVARLPPSAGPNSTCRPPALPTPPVCTGASAFTGATLASPRRVAYLMQIGFEGDTLEIALREVLDVVDVVFLVENTRSHNSKGEEVRVRKPLLWEHVKASERFQFVPTSKVVHIVIDDATTQRAVQARGTDIWSMESLESGIGIDRVKQWANATGFLRPDDVFVSGDVDELLARPVLHQLHWCEMADTVASSAIWMPMGRLDTAFQTDFPAPGLPLTLALPTIYAWKAVASAEFGGGRMHSLASARPNGAWTTTKGGMHMTNPAFLPLIMVKELTATEYGGNKPLGNTSLASLNLAQDEAYALERSPNLRARMVDVDKLPTTAAAWLRHIPWWLACNPQRYPYWYGRSEPRNAALLYALQQIARNASFDDMEICIKKSSPYKDVRV